VCGVRSEQAVDGNLQNVYLNLQQERQLREEEVAALQGSVYEEGNVRMEENTKLTGTALPESHNERASTRGEERRGSR
jgi:hypothetical protein